MVLTIKSLNTGSLEGVTGWYSMVLGQDRAVLVASMMFFQKIYGLHGLNHQMIEYSKNEKVITDKQTDRHTDRISSCRFDPFCRRGRVKTCRCLAAQKNEVDLMQQSLALQKNIRIVKGKTELNSHAYKKDWNSQNIHL